MKKQSEMDASCWRKGKTLDASNAEVSSVSEDGAGGGTRTHTMSPSADFESATSTNSITPARGIEQELLYAMQGLFASIIFTKAPALARRSF